MSGSPKVGVIARITGSDRTTVARWLRGDTEPRVPQLLAFVDRMAHRLVEFITLFVPPETLPSLRPLAGELSAQRRVAYELPWSHAVLRALELRSYRAGPKHVPGVIAAAIGVDVGGVLYSLCTRANSNVLARARLRGERAAALHHTAHPSRTCLFLMVTRAARLVTAFGVADGARYRALLTHHHVDGESSAQASHSLDATKRQSPGSRTAQTLDPPEVPPAPRLSPIASPAHLKRLSLPAQHPAPAQHIVSVGVS